MNLESFVDSLKLTLYEKEIVLFLSSVEDADAKTIYKNAKVPQGRIYSVLNELIQKGLVSSIPTKPKRYKIEDIKTSLRNYVERKQTELKEKYSAIEGIELKPKNIVLEKKTPSVSIYAGRDEHIAAVVDLRNRAKKELLQIAPTFAAKFSSRISMQKALQRGISVKLITVGITEKNREGVKNCLKYGGEVRSLENLEPLTLLVADSEEVLLGIQKRENSEERMVISSRNTALTKLLREYFFKLWKKAKPIKI